MSNTTKRRLSVNIATSAGAAVAGTLVMLVITPIIVQRLGVTAFALVPLVSQIFLYVTLPATVVNSVTSRYVMNEVASRRVPLAREYLSTSYFTNVGVALLAAPFLVLLGLRADALLGVPESHRSDFQWLLLWGFVGLLGTLTTTVLNVRLFVAGAFAEQAIANTVGVLSRAGLIILLFVLFKPTLFNVGVATACASWVTTVLTFALGARAAPDLRVAMRSFRPERLLRLARSGSWALVSQISFLLLSGGSLLIASALLGADEAAPYALALAIPNLVSGIVASTTNVFVPRLIIHSNAGNARALVNELLRGGRVVGFPVIAILAGVFAFGDRFYAAWVPRADAELLRILTVLVLLPMALFAVNGSIYSMYTVLDRLRLTALVTLTVGVASLCGAVALIALDMFSRPIIAVPFVTCVLMVAVNGIYHPLMVARLIGVERRLFLLQELRMLVWLGALTLVGFVARGWVQLSGWSGFVVTGGTFALLVTIAVGSYTLFLKMVTRPGRLDS